MSQHGRKQSAMNRAAAVAVDTTAMARNFYSLRSAGLNVRDSAQLMLTAQLREMDRAAGVPTNEHKLAKFVAKRMKKLPVQKS